ASLTLRANRENTADARSSPNRTNRRVSRLDAMPGDLPRRFSHGLEDLVADLRCRVLDGVGEEPGPHPGGLPVHPRPAAPRSPRVYRVVDHACVEEHQLAPVLAGFRQHFDPRVRGETF